MDPTSTTPQTHPLTQRQLELSFPAVIFYQPTNELLLNIWSCPMHLLTHLMRHPGERLSLISEAQKRSPTIPRSFYIYHPLLPLILSVNSSDMDTLLVLRIRELIVNQYKICQAFHYFCPPPPTPTFTLQSYEIPPSFLRVLSILQEP
jgi:hypothetical protein